MISAGETMRAATLIAPGQIRIDRVLVPVPAPGEVRVRLHGCGVCTSNLPPWEGRPWFTYPMEPGALGHEGWGIVDAVGEGVQRLRVGNSVASLGQKAYAEYDIVREASALPLPPSLRDHPFPGEPLGCAYNIFARSGIGPGKTVAVLGIGFLGALLVRLARNAGATRVIAVARRSWALDIAQQMGATETLPWEETWRVTEQVRATVGERLCDVVIEATGKQEGVDLGGELTGERGRLVIAGYHQDGLRQVNMQLWNWRGFDVINAHERDPAMYVVGTEAAMGLVGDGLLDPSPLYTHTLPLERLGEALELTRQRPEGFMKALITLQ